MKIKLLFKKTFNLMLSFILIASFGAFVFANIASTTDITEITEISIPTTDTAGVTNANDAVGAIEVSEITDTDGIIDADDISVTDDTDDTTDITDTTDVPSASEKIMASSFAFPAWIEVRYGYGGLGITPEQAALDPNDWTSPHPDFVEDYWIEDFPFGSALGVLMPPAPVRVANWRPAGWYAVQSFTSPVWDTPVDADTIITEAMMHNAWGDVRAVGAAVC